MRVLEKVSQTFWEDVAGSCLYATFFHTPYWSELMEKTFSYVDITKGFIFDDGTRAVFPFIQQKHNFFKGILDDYISGLLYVYGGPIADREMTRQQLYEIIEYINSAFKMYSTILIRGNPYGQDIKPISFKEVKDFSHVVELFRYKNEEDLFRSYSKRYRPYIRKAKKSNMAVIKESNSLVDYERLYQIYRKSFKYWGGEILTDYSLALFQNFYNLKNKYIKLWTTYYENKMIGGEITLYWNDYCVSFFPHYDREYSKLHGRRYTEHNIFLDCIEKGIKFYDFRQSGGVKGVEDFKESMGGRKYPNSSWIKENKFLKKIRSVKYSTTLFVNKLN